MGKLVQEFKEFVMRGNVLDLAVGVIIGGAFNTIVTSLCNDVIMPGIAWLVVTVSGQDLTTDGKVDFSKAMQSLNVGPINLGNFAAAIINFLIMAIIIFIFVKAINKLMTIGKKPVEETLYICSGTGRGSAQGRNPHHSKVIKQAITAL